MSIVMNEYKWAENAIAERKFSDKPYETLSRIARYYMYNGKSKNETRSLLEKFIMSCDSSTPIVKWDERIDSVMSYAEKRPLCVVDKITISVPEINKIKALDGIQLQRLAFTLLCISKFLRISNPKNEHWVNTPDNEIMKMANIGTSIKRQSIMFSKLKELEMIKFSAKIDNLSVQVLFEEDGDPAVEITDFRNIGYQYMDYLFGGYFRCMNCGLTCKCNKQSDKKQIYCPDCAAKIHMRQNIESVMRKRHENKSVGIC